jgi:tripartite-type tricarboxylate transporter receptor subunit TctC
MKQWIALAALATLSMGSYAQAFPGSKPISIVVPFAAGGPTDRVARDLAEVMRKHIPGSNFVVENAAGAGGTIGATKVARAAPDGHTLLVWHIGMAATAGLYRKLQYKPLEDFEYLGMINDVPMTLIGKPALPANTYRDFENYIRANAGKLNLAHAGMGSASHICGLLWQSSIKADETMTTIPFNGTGPAMMALMGGQVDVMCDQTTNTTAQIEGGRVKAFAVTTAKPLSNHPVLKHYPTLQEMGLRNFNLSIWHGLYAPRGTPRPVLERLNKALNATITDASFNARIAEFGAVSVAPALATPEGLRTHLAKEIALWGPIIAKAGQFAD